MVGFYHTYVWMHVVKVLWSGGALVVVESNGEVSFHLTYLRLSGMVS